MGFATALSGLAAAQTDLQVIGNNIANSNTTGFKESRLEFADILVSTSPTVAGPGVRVSEVAQQFNQGNIEATQNNLDLAISGNGFFAMGEKVDSTNPTAYTRNGAFQLDPNGFLINDSGFFLMGGSPVGKTVAEGFNIGSPTALKVDTAQGKPSATKKVDIKVNLDPRTATKFTAAAFPGFTGPGFTVVPDPSTYNNSTSVTMFDSLGNTHKLSMFFVDISTGSPLNNKWEVYSYLDGKAITVGTPSTITSAAKGTAVPMEFDNLGVLKSTATGTDTTAGSADDFVFSNIDLGLLVVGAAPLSLTMNPTGSTQFAADFGVNDVQQDGFASGNLTGVSFDKTGVLTARFSNGTTSPLGQVLLGRFTSNQGLSKLGDTTWQESVNSGTVVLDVAGGNNFGDLQSSALENSNTDIATQLVKMIVAQQTYQANAQTISTEDEIIQRILQL